MRPITGPKQTIIVTSRGKSKVYGKHKESDNMAALHLHMLASKNPPAYTISIPKGMFTAELIKSSGVFCINFVDDKMKGHIENIDSFTGKHVDKFKDLGIDKEECHAIDCPRLKKATAHLECEFMHEQEIGDNVLITGKIVKGSAKKNQKRLYNFSNSNYDLRNI